MKNINRLLTISMLLITPFVLMYTLNFIGFCWKEMRFTSPSESISIQSLKNRIGDDNLSLNELESFFRNHPKNISANDYHFLSFGERYYTYMVYFYPPSKIVKSKDLFAKEIVGLSLWQSYSICGHPTYAMEEKIYRNDDVDKKFNPYRKNNE